MGKELRVPGKRPNQFLNACMYPAGSHTATATSICMCDYHQNHNLPSFPCNFFFKNPWFNTINQKLVNLPLKLGNHNTAIYFGEIPVKLGQGFTPGLFAVFPEDSK